MPSRVIQPQHILGGLQKLAGLRGNVGAFDLMGKDRDSTKYLMPDAWKVKGQGAKQTVAANVSLTKPVGAPAGISSPLGGAAKISGQDVNDETLAGVDAGLREASQPMAGVTSGLDTQDTASAPPVNQPLKTSTLA